MREKVKHKEIILFNVEKTKATQISLIYRTTEQLNVTIQKL
jgi:hypothetical protein